MKGVKIAIILLLLLIIIDETLFLKFYYPLYYPTKSISLESVCIIKENDKVIYNVDRNYNEMDENEVRELLYPLCRRRITGDRGSTTPVEYSFFDENGKILCKIYFQGCLNQCSIAIGDTKYKNYYYYE